MRSGIISMVVLLVAVAVFCINIRTPFYLPIKGGWSIGYGFYDSLPPKLPVEGNSIFSIEKLSNINDSTVFLADPFYLRDRDTFFLFFEIQFQKEGADIALMKSVDGKTFNYDRIVLDEPFHLSYPCVFKHNNGYYMLPETKQANNILLYQACNFPYNWIIADTLVKNVRLKDPSIYLSDTLNFLVACDDTPTLFMYLSDSLLGKWEINHQRRIVAFGSEARPAGRIFVNEKKRITIPLQNSTKGYGYGVSLYELIIQPNHNYNLKRSNKFFLEANPFIDEFSAGMHHIDIQKQNDQYFIVYDGNYLLKDEKHQLNWKGVFKQTYLDTKNYFHQLVR